jgi:hypothetical protein
MARNAICPKCDKHQLVDVWYRSCKFCGEPNIGQSRQGLDMLASGPTWNAFEAAQGILAIPLVLFLRLVDALERRRPGVSDRYRDRNDEFQDDDSLHKAS